MKCIFIILVFMMNVSCGKKAENSSANVVTTTPPISVEDEVGNLIEGDQFSIASNKEEYAANEPILITIKNLGESVLNHLAFSFSTEPSAAVVKNLNCFSLIFPGEECVFSLMMQNPEDEIHLISVVYVNEQTELTLSLNVNVIVDESVSELNFLYRKDHTFTDCESITKYSSKGTVVSKQNSAFCKFKAVHWNLLENSKIDIDPLQEFHDVRINSDQFYCHEDWSLYSFEFKAAKVEEVKNIFGGKRDIVIPAGESREVCVKRNIFGCKEKKVFYSRLVAVKCY